MTYEELVKRLKSSAKWYEYGMPIVPSICLKAADAIEELSRDLDSMNDANIALYGALPQWIRFTTRPLTDEENEEHPEWGCILDCKLPDDGQDILVSNGRWVTVDTFFSDDGCYLDSNGDLEGLWWMPLPEPPKEET